MFHKAIELKFKKGTMLEVVFQSGDVVSYDVARLFDEYPFMVALKNRKLFLSGRLEGNYGIVWNDEIDLSAEEVYKNGIVVERKELPIAQRLGSEINEARNIIGITQSELAEKTGIDQSDISKIERGVSNPSLQTLERIAQGLGATLQIKYLIGSDDYVDKIINIDRVAETIEF